MAAFFLFSRVGRTFVILLLLGQSLALISCSFISILCKNLSNSNRFITVKQLQLLNTKYSVVHGY